MEIRWRPSFGSKEAHIQPDPSQLCNYGYISPYLRSRDQRVGRRMLRGHSILGKTLLKRTRLFVCFGGLWVFWKASFGRRGERILGTSTGVTVCSGDCWLRGEMWSSSGRTFFTVGGQLIIDGLGTLGINMEHSDLDCFWRSSWFYLVKNLSGTIKRHSHWPEVHCHRAGKSPLDIRLPPLQATHLVKHLNTCCFHFQYPPRSNYR